MKRRWVVFFLLMGLLLMAVGLAGAAQQFQLKDGSVISGELLSYQNGVYTIKTGSLGVLKIDGARVRSIGEGSAAPSADRMGAIRQQIQGDAGMMKMIDGLQNDPDLMKALNDPEFMRAVQSGDLDALQKSDRMKRIMNHPDIQKMVREMMGN